MALRLYVPEDELPDPDDVPDLPEVLRRLEIPDCHCPRVPVPCEHVGRWALGKDGKKVYLHERRVLDHEGRSVPCDCPYYFPPCKHVVQAWHDFPFDKWLTLLSLAAPEHYHDRPLPLFPEQGALTREARVAVYAEREELGFGLWHPEDLWRNSAWDDRIQVGVEIDQGANGALGDGRLRRAG